jgi:murein DD-endopeptidase MepM/ murein hydrolase activator NlpD
MAQGVPALAGNFVIIQLNETDTFVALVHLRKNSLRVRAGDRVATGYHLAECGNSGNSTQPHVHVQAMTSRDLSVARGIPILFRRYREQQTRSREFELREFSIPRNGAVIEP